MQKLGPNLWHESVFTMQCTWYFSIFCKYPLKWKHVVSVHPRLSPLLLHFCINTSKHTHTHTQRNIDRNKNSLLNCQYFISTPCGQAAVMYDGLSMRRRLGNISSAGESLWFIMRQGLIARQANGQEKGKKCVIYEHPAPSYLFLHQEPASILCHGEQEDKATSF